MKSYALWLSSIRIPKPPAHTHCHFNTESNVSAINFPADRMHGGHIPRDIEIYTHFSKSCQSSYHSTQSCFELYEGAAEGGLLFGIQ